MPDEPLSQDAIEALLAAESGGPPAPANDGPLSQDERKRVERFAVILGRQAE